LGATYEPTKGAEAVKQVRTYETEKAAHEKTRLERNEATRLKNLALGTVRGLEAKVKRLEAELKTAREWEVVNDQRVQRAEAALDDLRAQILALVGVQ
jgi:hypothetical protein